MKPQNHATAARKENHLQRSFLPEVSGQACCINHPIHPLPKQPYAPSIRLPTPISPCQCPPLHSSIVTLAPLRFKTLFQVHHFIPAIPVLVTAIQPLKSVRSLNSPYSPPHPARLPPLRDRHLTHYLPHSPASKRRGAALE